MKRKLEALSRRYGAALQKHLRPSRLVGSSLEAAQGLGRQAVAMGLETLDMARIHEQALVTFNGWMRDGRGQRSEVRGQEQAGSARLGSDRRRARAFFAEAINPIEETHLTAREARVHLGQVSEALRRRTVELADSNRQLKRRIIKRKTSEDALRQSGKHQATLLKESLQLQERLRRLTHRLLLAQESERKKISRGLRDEIAQTLLGINVRLLSIRAGAMVKSKRLDKDIASARMLVARSAKTMECVARGFEQGSKQARRDAALSESGSSAKAGS